MRMGHREDLGRPKEIPWPGDPGVLQRSRQEIRYCREHNCWPPATNMAGTVLTDSESEPRVERPVCKLKTHGHANVWTRQYKSAFRTFYYPVPVICTVFNLTMGDPLSFPGFHGAHRGGRKDHANRWVVVRVAWSGILRR